MPKILASIVTIFLFQSTVIWAEGPEDFAIALRETQIYASLEPYADIVASVKPKQFFPLLQIVKDQYGIQWAEVEVEEGTTGYLTDMITVRKKRAELTEILEKSDLQELSQWTEDDLESFDTNSIKTGITETQLLFVSGIPLEVKSRGSWKEYIYPRTRVLMLDGQVEVFSQVVRLSNDKWIKKLIIRITIVAVH